MSRLAPGSLFRGSLSFLLALALAGCTSGVNLGMDAVKNKTPAAFMEMHEVQAAYIGSGRT